MFQSLKRAAQSSHAFTQCFFIRAERYAQETLTLIAEGGGGNRNDTLLQASFGYFQIFAVLADINHGIERPLRSDGAQSEFVTQQTEQMIAPSMKDSAILGARGSSFVCPGSKCGFLRDARRARHDVSMQNVCSFHHISITCQPAKAPAGHAHQLRQTADDDRAWIEF